MIEEKFKDESIFAGIVYNTHAITDFYKQACF